jgi:hypothetical protein
MRSVASPDLALLIVSHRVDLAFNRDNDCVQIATSDVSYLVWNPGNVKRSHFIVNIAETQLASVIPSTNEKSADIINKACVEAACRDGFDVWFVILIEINSLRRIVLRHLLSRRCATLAILIATPGEDISLSRHDDSVHRPAAYRHWFQIKQRVNKHRAKLVVKEGLVNAKLAEHVAAHSVAKV